MHTRCALYNLSINKYKLHALLEGYTITHNHQVPVLLFPRIKLRDKIKMVLQYRR